MAYKEHEKITKDYSEELITELINYQGDNLIEKIIRFGLQKLMEMDRVDHIGVASITVINPGSIHIGNFRFASPSLASFTAMKPAVLCTVFFG